MPNIGGSVKSSMCGVSTRLQDQTKIRGRHELLQVRALAVREVVDVCRLRLPQILFYNIRC